MRAIILDTRPHGTEAAHFNKSQRLPACLLRLGDRPFLQHVVECLALQGIRKFDFAFSDSPRPAAGYLGDGSRWGCEFHFHSISKAGVGPLIRSLTKGVDDAFLVGPADRLPAFPPLAGLNASLGNQPLFFVRQPETLPGAPPFTGWALFPHPESLLAQISAAGSRSPAAEDWLLPEYSVAQAVCASQLSVETPKCVLRSQQELLTNGFPGLVLGGRQAEPGIWLGRNVFLDPSARLTAPLYIGTNSRIGPRAQVGPFAVLAEDCIVGAESTIHDALICPSTYVGEGLDVHQSIVDRNHVTDVRLGTSYRVTDNFLLGSLDDERHAYAIRHVVDRVIAALLLLLFSPLLALRLILNAHRPETIVRADVMRIPEQPEQHAWKSYPLYKLRLTSSLSKRRASHFWSVFLPGLISVVKGDLSLVGVQPRSPAEVAHLPEDWRALYLQTKAGLITDAVVNFAPQPSEEELHASECYYSATESFTQDLRLMASYLLKVSAAPFNTAPHEAALDDIAPSPIADAPAIRQTSHHAPREAQH